MSLEFFVRFLDIMIINIVLSGDNVIVIGMAAASLPREQRKWALVFGGGCAILLRVLLTSFASCMMRIVYLSLVSGIFLIWIVYKLLIMDSGDSPSLKTARSLKQAIMVILLADIMMSLDNVLAVAGAARGDTPSLIIGLILSMPLLMLSGGFVSMVIDKIKWVVYVGAFAIAFTSVRMILEDKAIEHQMTLSGLARSGLAIGVGAFITVIFTLLARRKKGNIAIAG